MTGGAGRYERSQLIAASALVLVAVVLGALLLSPAEGGGRPDIEAGRGAPMRTASSQWLRRATTSTTAAPVAAPDTAATSTTAGAPATTQSPAVRVVPSRRPAATTTTTASAAPSASGPVKAAVGPTPTTSGEPETSTTTPAPTTPAPATPTTSTAPTTTAVSTVSASTATAGTSPAMTAAPAATRATAGPVSTTVPATTTTAATRAVSTTVATAPIVTVASTATAATARPVSTTALPAPVTTPEVPAAPVATTAATRPGTTTTTTAVPVPAAQTPAPGALDAACRNPVTVRPPAADLAAVVAAAPPGTCFRLPAGEYRFRDVTPKDGMTFLGASRSSVVVLGSDTAENAFNGTARDVTIGRMTLRGFQGSAGQLRQQQAAIRGSAGIWRTGPGELASGWLIEDVESSGNYALGLLLGDRFTVRGSTFADNGVAGIGGAATRGGLVQGNVVTGNGYLQLTGYEANGGGMKFTQAAGPGEPLVIDRNEIHHNKGSGVWCDIGCTGFEVTGNYIHDQDSHGVVVELSSGAEIRNNLLVDTNTWTDYTADFNGGAITVAESSGVTVEGNYVDGARAGVVVRQTRRPLLPQEQFLYGYAGVNWISGDVLVRGNVFVRIAATGVSTGTTGTGLIGDPGSIRFEANVYADAGSMAFWWDGGRRLDVQGWRAAGRDLGAGDVVPARPVWTGLSS